MKLKWHRKIQGVMVEAWADTGHKRFGCSFDLVDGNHWFERDIEEEEGEAKLGQLEADIASFVYECLTKLLRAIKKGY